MLLVFPGRLTSLYMNKFKVINEFNNNNNNNNDFIQFLKSLYTDNGAKYQNPIYKVNF